MGGEFGAFQERDDLFDDFAGGDDFDLDLRGPHERLVLNRPMPFAKTSQAGVARRPQFGDGLQNPLLDGGVNDEDGFEKTRGF